MSQWIFKCEPLRTQLLALGHGLLYSVLTSMYIISITKDTGAVLVHLHQAVLPSLTWLSLP